MSGLPAVVAKTVVAIAFPFACWWLRAFTGIAPTFATVEATFARALALATAFDEVYLAVGLRD